MTTKLKTKAMWLQASRKQAKEQQKLIHLTTGRLQIIQMKALLDIKLIDYFSQKAYQFSISLTLSYHANIEEAVKYKNTIELRWKTAFFKL